MIKTLAVILGIIGNIGSLIAGCVYLEEFPVEGLLIIVGGAFISCIGPSIMYGFGHLIENSDLIKENSDLIIQLLIKLNEMNTGKCSYNEVYVNNTNSESDEKQHNTSNKETDNDNNTISSKNGEANSNEIEPNIDLPDFDFDFAVQNQKYYMIHVGQCSCCGKENRYVALCNFVQHKEKTIKLICKDCFIRKNAKLELK